MNNGAPTFRKLPAGSCPLCQKRPLSERTIYGHRVCKHCSYDFASRRQIAYLIDAVFFLVPATGATYALNIGFDRVGLDGFGLALAQAIAGLALMSLFLTKDGFAGFSPGKRILGLQVRDQSTGRPIGFAQSFQRNAILLIGQIPVPIAGPLIGLFVILIIAMQVARGPRLGDRQAKTQVIWLKYAQTSVFGNDALLCECCGYDLHGNVSGTCPECGNALSDRVATRLATVR